MPEAPDPLAALMAQLTADDRVAKVLAKTPALETGLDTAQLAIHRRVIHTGLNHEGINNAAAQIHHLPAPQHAVSCIMGGNYHGFDIIPAIQRLACIPILDLTIATLSFSKRNISNLTLLLDQGLIQRVGLLTSDYFAKADALIYGAAKRELVELRGQRLAFTRNHAKVICIRTAAGHYVVESSANLRSCVNFEQFTLTHDESFYQWHLEWIEYLLATGGK